MKKFFIIGLAVVLALAFAGMSYAQAKLDFKVTGRFDAEAHTGRNAPRNSPNADTAIPGPPPNFRDPTGLTGGVDHGYGWLNSRGTLIMTAAMGKEVSGTVIFEMDALPWGSADGTRNAMGFWTADRAAVEVKNVYFDFGVPGVPFPTTARVGVQPLAIRPTFFLYTDGPGVRVGMKFDPLTISPFWFKAFEGNEFTSDDVDIYGVDARADIDKITVGGYVVNYNMNTYPLFVGSPPAPGNDRANFWWLGAYVDGKLGPVNLNFDFVYDNGKVEERGAVPLGADDEVDYSGWRTRAKIDYPWEKFNFGFIGGYGTGADARKTDTRGLPGQLVADGGIGFSRKVKTSVVPPGSEQTVMFGESLIFYSSPVVRYTGWAANLQGNAVGPGSLGGTWFAKLYGTYKVAPDFKVTLQGLYIGDTTKNGNTVGTARKLNGRLEDDSDIGWEFDLITELRIFKNLTWQAGAGYMFFGDAMDFRHGTTPTGFPINTSINNAWALQSRLMYVF